MKEKIRKILTVDRGVVYGDIPGLIADLKFLVNQEVEKRIAERMPSIYELMQEFEGAYGYLTNSTKRQIWRHSLWAIELFQSRLTKDGAESSQKTEGGEG